MSCGSSPDQWEGCAAARGEEVQSFSTFLGRRTEPNRRLAWVSRAGLQAGAKIYDGGNHLVVKSNQAVLMVQRAGTSSPKSCSSCSTSRSSSFPGVKGPHTLFISITNRHRHICQDWGEKLFRANDWIMILADHSRNVTNFRFLIHGLFIFLLKKSYDWEGLGSIPYKRHKWKPWDIPSVLLLAHTHPQHGPWMHLLTFNK